MTVVDGARSRLRLMPPRCSAPCPRYPAAGDASRIVGLALLGGLILNLMPCVLPVLSLKLLALVGYAGGERRGHASACSRPRWVSPPSGARGGAGPAESSRCRDRLGHPVPAALVPRHYGACHDAVRGEPVGLASFALPGGIAGAAASVRGLGRIQRRIPPGRLCDLARRLLLGAVRRHRHRLRARTRAARHRADIRRHGPRDGGAFPDRRHRAGPGRLAATAGSVDGWLRRVLGLALLGTAAWLLSVLALEAGLDAALLAGGTLAVLWQCSLAPRPGSGTAHATTAALPQLRWPLSRCWSRRCEGRPCRSRRRYRTPPPGCGGRSMKRRCTRWWQSRKSYSWTCRPPGALPARSTN